MRLSTMRLISVVGAFFAWVPGATADNCTPPIQTSIIEKDEASRSDYNSWLCTTDFGTHEEARNFGLGLGALVYGVPLQASGKFDSKTKSEWKKTHCEGQTSSHLSATRYRAFLRFVPPEAYKAWVDCKRVTAYGVQCWFESSDTDWKAVTFLAKWNPVDGDKGGAPKIKSGDIIGAGRADKKPFLAGHTSLGANLGILLVREPEGAPVTAILNTSRGACPAVAEGHPPEFVPTFEMKTKPISFEKNPHHKEPGGRGTMIRYEEDLPGEIVSIAGPTGWIGEGCGWVTFHRAWADPATRLHVEASTNSGAPCSMTFNVTYKALTGTKCVKYCQFGVSSVESAAAEGKRALGQ